MSAKKIVKNFAAKPAVSFKPTVATAPAKKAVVKKPARVLVKAAPAAKPSPYVDPFEVARPGMLWAGAQTPAKSAFTVNYTEHRRGHAPETKQAVIAAETLGAAVAHLEGLGCTVNSAYSVLEGAQFIDV